MGNPDIRPTRGIIYGSESSDQDKVKKKRAACLWVVKRTFTSMDVETFFSLILSYFCFLFPAFSPCHGRLKPRCSTCHHNERVQEMKWSEACSRNSPSFEEIHKDITKRLKIISSALFLRFNDGRKQISVKSWYSKHVRRETGTHKEVLSSFTNSQVGVHTSITCSSCQVLVFSANRITGKLVFQLSYYNEIMLEVRTFERWYNDISFTCRECADVLYYPCTS